MPKNRESERCFGDENVTRNWCKGRARGVGHILVVAGTDDTEVRGLDQDLRCAEHVAGGMETRLDATDAGSFTVIDRLRAAGEIFAIAQTHQVERLRGCQHRAMAGPGVVGVRMGNQRAGNRPRRIDMEPTLRAA